MRGANISAHVPFPLHGGVDLAHGGGWGAGDVPEAGGVLSDAQDEGALFPVSFSLFVISVFCLCRSLAASFCFSYPLVFYVHLVLSRGVLSVVVEHAVLLAPLCTRSIAT